MSHEVIVKDTKWPASVVRETAPYLGLGVQMAAAVLVFYFLGSWADTKFNTAPWLMLAGVMLGVVGGFIKLYKIVVDLNKKELAAKDDGTK